MRRIHGLHAGTVFTCHGFYQCPIKQTCHIFWNNLIQSLLFVWLIIHKNFSGRLFLRRFTYFHWKHTDQLRFLTNGIFKMRICQIDLSYFSFREIVEHSLTECCCIRICRIFHNFRGIYLDVISFSLQYLNSFSANCIDHDILFGNIITFCDQFHYIRIISSGKSTIRSQYNDRFLFGFPAS